MNYRLTKDDRLHGRTAINSLFAEGQSLMAFPLRAVVRLYTSDCPRARMMVSVPKKRVRRAVGRVRLRRLVREAYRLCRHRLLDDALAGAGKGADIAILYLDSDIATYDVVSAKVENLLSRVAALL